MKSWSFFGGPGSLPYRFFDRIRARLNRCLVAYLLEKAIFKECSRVLEAGSGSAFASSLFSRHERVSLSVALDIDIDALDEARRRDPSLPAVAADLYHLPFAPETFDLVWNSSTLEHLGEPEKALAEMQRVAKLSGYVFVGVPYRLGPLGIQRWLANTKVGSWIGPAFGKAELRTMLGDRGLRPVNTRPYFFHFFIGVLARR
jgi:SAM-dependent methyltransferase